MKLKLKQKQQSAERNIADLEQQFKQYRLLQNETSMATYILMFQEVKEAARCFPSQRLVDLNRQILNQIQEMMKAETLALQFHSLLVVMENAIADFEASGFQSTRDFVSLYRQYNALRGLINSCAQFAFDLIGANELTPEARTHLHEIGKLQLLFSNTAFENGLKRLVQEELQLDVWVIRKLAEVDAIEDKMHQMNGVVKSLIGNLDRLRA